MILLLKNNPIFFHLPMIQLKELKLSKIISGLKQKLIGIMFFMYKVYLCLIGYPLRGISVKK